MSKTINKERWRDILRLLKRGLRHIFLHNGWVKLLAILISIALWAGLISQDPNVIRNKTFNNVDIEIEGHDELKRKGRIVTTGLDELLTGVTMTAAVPQLQYEDADPSAYNLHVDLNSIRSTGEQEVRILSDNSSEYGDVISINPSTIKVNVEQYLTYQTVPITVRTEGEIPENWYISQLAVEPKTVSVSGPASMITQLSRGIVTLDLSARNWEEGTFRTIGTIKLQNLKGEEITSPLITISSNGNNSNVVIMQAEILPSRTYSLSEMVQIKGEPEKGYTVDGEPVFSPDAITIAASGASLDELDEKAPEQRGAEILDSQSIDITGLTDTTVFTLNVNPKRNWTYIQPTGGTVSVTVNIRKAENAAEPNPEETVQAEPPVTEP